MLPSGKKYRDLKNSVIIFLCTFDLLDEGLHRYTVRKRPDESLHRVIEDGVYEVYLNTRGTADDIDVELKEFLYYVEHTTDQVAEASLSKMVKLFHTKIKQIRRDSGVRREFMTFQEKLEEERECGMEEGRADGREEMRSETAERLLRRGVDMDIIIDATGYSHKEIEQIKESMLTCV